jgi:DDE superfamily endonuclease
VRSSCYPESRCVCRGWLRSEPGSELCSELDFIQTQRKRQVGYTRIASTPKEVIRAAPTCRHGHMVALLSQFASLFSRRVWRHIPLLVVGAILVPGRRMVSTVLRTVGLSQEQHFQTYHRVLNRAVWSRLKASRILLRLLVLTFAPSGPIVLGIDETIERRRGAARGQDRRSRQLSRPRALQSPLLAILSKSTACAGSVSCYAPCSWCRFLGQVECGPCRS